jgi:hypothetical protein
MADATPLYETVVRAVTFIVALWAAVESARATGSQPRPVRPLLVYLTGILVLIAVWRGFVLAIGLVADEGPALAWVEPYVRTIGTSLLLLLLFGVGLIAAFHRRRG